MPNKMKKMLGIFIDEKADLRLKLEKYGNETRLVISSMKIGRDDIRLKWKK